MRAFALAASLIAGLGVVALTAPAKAAPPPIQGWYTGHLPGCDDGWALARIQWRFAQKEGRFWNSALAIQGFDKVREIAYRPWGASYVPRRYCQAVAHVSDGKPRPVYYSIIEDGGMTGIGTGVEWCVVGLDRNWAYNPRCRAARP